VQRLADSDPEAEERDRDGEPDGPADEEGATTATATLAPVERRGHGT
jgi:hypothetical protein